jgi:hypothetical protein
MCHFTMSSSPCLLSFDAGIPTCHQSSGLPGVLVHRFHGPAHDIFDLVIFFPTSFLRDRDRDSCRGGALTTGQHISKSCRQN